jgi:hypothetical protein
MSSQKLACKEALRQVFILRVVDLGQQQTENYNTCERCRYHTNPESVRMLTRVTWGVIRAFQSDIKIFYSPQPAAPHY